jgi:hypothetical protein
MGAMRNAAQAAGVADDVVGSMFYNPWLHLLSLCFVAEDHLRA